MNRMILFMAMAGVGLGQKPQDVTVCDLLSGLSLFNGEMVRVTADIEYDGLPERGPALSGKHCAISIVIKGIAFPSLIEITRPQEKLWRVHAVEFDWDPISDSEFTRLLLAVDPKTEHIRATVVGLFETRTPVDSLVYVNSAHPKGNRFGFGVGNVLPAQILVKTMTRLRIEKNRASSPKRVEQ